MAYQIDYTGSGLNPQTASGGNPAVQGNQTFNGAQPQAQMYRTPSGQYSTDPAVLGGNASPVIPQAPSQPSPSGTNFSSQQPQGSPSMFPTTPQPGEPMPQQYQVQQGDNIYSLASRYGVSVNDLLSANKGLGMTPAAGSTIQVPQSQQTQTTAQKYQGMFSRPPSQDVISNPAAARSYIADSSTQSTPPTDPNTQAVNQLLNDYVGGIQELNNFENTKQTVQQYQASLDSAYQVPQMQQELMSINTTMNGTDDDIRKEISAAGGFATESQVQGMVYTRNKALVKQATNIENQLSIAQQNVGMAVSAYQADYSQTSQALSDRISGDSNILGLYQNMKTQAVSNYNKDITLFGFQDAVKLWSNNGQNPQALRAAESALGWQQGSLSDPKFVSSMETEREKQMQLSNGRFDIYASSQAALNISRYTMASNRIISSYIQLPAFQLLANAQPMLARIEAASTVPGSVADNDLLDSVLKLNTGGQALTDAQVSTITGGRSVADTFNVFQNKFLQKGGVLSNDQRTQLFNLAQAVYSNYQKEYQPVYNVVQQKLQQSGVPQQYWTMPDLNNLSQLSGLVQSTPDYASQYTQGVQNGTINKGDYLVQDVNTGQTGSIPANEYDASKYQILYQP